MSDRSNPRPYSAATSRRAPTDPVHVTDAIAEAVPAITGRVSAHPGPSADPERTGWVNPAYDIEANEEIVPDIDRTLSAAILLVEKGARSDAHKAILQAGNSLRDGVPLDVVGAALVKAGDGVCTLATASAKVRAALEAVEL